MELMEGRFIRRLNRFVAEVELGGRAERCHVKNTGRLRELLVPGAVVFCEVHDDPARKTKFSLVLVKKGEQLVSIDSQAPNQAAYDYVAAGGLGGVPSVLRREVTYGDSRFDLFFELCGRPAFLEVKGVTLEQGGVARFPDAPTERGTKHLRGLRRAVAEGYDAYVLFVIQMQGVSCFAPNDAQDPAFGLALREAAANGVHVLAVCCDVTESGIKIAAPVPVRLGDGSFSSENAD